MKLPRKTYAHYHLYHHRTFGKAHTVSAFVTYPSI